MYVDFDDIPNNSRLWIFQSESFIPYEKIERISARILNFLEEWQAHGKDLKASFQIKYDRFLIIALDEASYQATGCSIDKLTHLIARLEKELNISLLDRTQIAYRDDNEMIDTMHMMDFRAALESQELDENTIVFNNLIERKSQLEEKWEVPISRSWHKQWLPIA